MEQATSCEVLNDNWNTQVSNHLLGQPYVLLLYLILVLYDELQYNPFLLRHTALRNQSHKLHTYTHNVRYM